MTNYDGQGKTRQQETDDGLTMLVLVCAWMLFCAVMGLMWWLVL